MYYNPRNEKMTLSKFCFRLFWPRHLIANLPRTKVFRQPKGPGKGDWQPRDLRSSKFLKFSQFSRSFHDLVYEFDNARF